MQHVAFFRNLNQGQRGHPPTAELLAAFADADAADAVAFQSNGTILFSAADPDAVIDEVRSILSLDAAYVRPVSVIEAVVAQYGYGSDSGRYELTLFPLNLEIVDADAASAQSRRRLCEVVAHGCGWAVVRNDHDRQSNGTPTVEALLGVPATSRGLPTLVRLLEKSSGR